MLTFDELRERYPDDGFAVYAYEPGGPVTLEVLASADTESFSITQPTLRDVLALLEHQLNPAPKVYSVLD